MSSLTSTTEWRPSCNLGPNVMPSILSSGVSPGVVVKSLTNDLNIGNTARDQQRTAQDIGGAVDIGVVDAHADAFVAIRTLHDQEGGVHQRDEF